MFVNKLSKKADLNETFRMLLLDMQLINFYN